MSLSRQKQVEGKLLDFNTETAASYDAPAQLMNYFCLQEELKKEIR